MNATYEIGGVSVRMTEAQADRWNNGDATQNDLRVVRVFLATTNNQCREISLRRALNSVLEPEACAMLSGMSANRVR